MLLRFIVHHSLQFVVFLHFKRIKRMKYIFEKPIRVFIVLVLLIGLPLFLFPINFFSGEVIFQRGLVEIVEQRPLSLSYFVGMGYDPKDLIEVKDFYLLKEGYILAIIFIVGVPFLAAYRVYLSQQQKKKSVKK